MAPRKKPTTGVGELLRQWRKQAGLSGQALAERTGVTQATVSRIEAGKISVSFVYLARMVKALGIATSEAAPVFEALRKENPSLGDIFSTFDFASGNFITEGQRSALAEESNFKYIKLFTPSLVPGQMQTRAYAKSLLSRFTSLPERELSNALDLRMERQEAFLRGKTRWQIIVTEPALRNRVAELGAMIDQIQFLNDIVERGGNFTFGIIPLGAELTVIPPQTFFLYEDHTVYTEFGHGDAYLSSRESVSKYAALFEGLSASALCGADAIAKLRQIRDVFLDLRRLQTEMGGR